MLKTPSGLLLSRRGLLRALGATAITQLPGCGGGTVAPAAQPPPPPVSVGEPPPPPPSVSVNQAPPPPPLPAVADGYTDQQSYRPGDRVTLFLNSPVPGRATLHLRDYNNAPVLEFTAELATQAALGPNPWETGFGYQASATFTLPELTSGVYWVERLIPVIAKTAPAENAEVVILYPSNTMAAYNTAGGRSMYSAPEPAPIVSFNRPAWPTNNSPFFDSFLRWFATLHLPYSLRFLADIDLEDYSEISGSKLLLVIGHSEYWTRGARENFDRFVLEGGNALLLSGNNMWWQVRYSEDLSQLICYKRAPDPIADQLLQTTNWPDSILRFPVIPSIGGDWEHGGFKGDGFHVVLPNSPVFSGVDVQSGELISMQTTEYDGAPLLNSPVTQGEPRLDLNALGAYRAELIGYAPCFGSETLTDRDRIGTWIVQQRTATSGIVINGGSTGWCSNSGVGGPDGARVQKIILNMIDILANRRPAFVS
jgi:hypothetical protein